MGKQDMVFAGGSEELHWTLSNMFDAMGAMSTKYNDTPETASRAYDVSRDGFVIAGGAGVLVLEELEHAKARGAKIYAEVAGYGATSDGDDMVAPSGEGAMRCMKMALETVKVPIDYINRTPPRRQSRCAEIGAMRDVFGDKCRRFRRQIAHRPFARRRWRSGGDLLATDDEQRFICESANIQNIDPAFADMPILRERKDNVKLGAVLSNSFGFGGTNASIVLKHVDA